MGSPTPSLSAGEPASTDVPSRDGKSPTSEPVDDAQLGRSLQWLADLAVQRMPETVRGERDWGDTKRLWAGVEVRRDGWKLKTHRKWREVKHGRWIRYEVYPHPTNTDRDIGSGASPIELRVTRVSSSDDTWIVHSVATAPVRFQVRIQRWNLGVRWYSVRVEGRARVRLDSKIRVRFKPDYAEIPPALVIDPLVNDAVLKLQSFDIERVSKIGGEVAEEIGVVVERQLKRHWLDRLNEKLPEKLNRSIDRHRDELRVSLVGQLGSWWPNNDASTRTP